MMAARRAFVVAVLGVCTAVGALCCSSSPSSTSNCSTLECPTGQVVTHNAVGTDSCSCTTPTYPPGDVDSGASCVPPEAGPDGGLCPPGYYYEVTDCKCYYPAQPPGGPPPGPKPDASADASDAADAADAADAD